MPKGVGAFFLFFVVVVVVFFREQLMFCRFWFDMCVDL